MLSTQSFGLIELLLVFGGALALGVYQLLSVRRLLRRRTEAHDDERSGRRGMR